ncbi:hypothetical protein CBER1_05274 [Cercospora berteroae]|uniref:gamma-glutamylcyclotransferase n=1 Tax=Cercospora berteroae TaxID=357750 RepID=A0A2S6CEC9_9PEZI|nr:hypothetical protein CBER1_05274 [Cercospora berteroae]
MATRTRNPDMGANDRVAASTYTACHAISDHTLSIPQHSEDPHDRQIRRPRPSPQRLTATFNDRAYDVETFARESSKEETVLYLAYGSNLAYEKFQDPKSGRGIKPLAQINVQVPSLRMTFDLPGIPYTEPCFANSAISVEKDDDVPGEQDAEQTALLDDRSRRPDYRKDRWHKGLMGVVYEVTAADYAHIIATEGGGASYKDILVDCYPLESEDPRATVPQHPSTTPFKAHTLFAPAVPDGEKPPKNGGRIQRPDQSYAQASARYLKLITDGAAECEMPYEYQDYLHSLHPFKITTVRQRMGQVLLAATFVPLVLFLFTISKRFADKHGVLPNWFKALLGALFKATWVSYDHFFKPLFGEGERTIGDDGSDGESKQAKRNIRAVTLEIDVEKAAAGSNG